MVINQQKRKNDTANCVIKLENSLSVEDEFHFLMVCPLYRIKRENMLENIYKSFPMILQISLREQFLWLMSQENVNCTKEIAKFITQSMKLRFEELEKMTSPENARPIRTTRNQERRKNNNNNKIQKVNRNCKLDIVIYC